MATDEAANPKEPYWLLWAREIQALAQTGLAFTRDQYDRERYQRLRALAAEIMTEHAGANMPDIEISVHPTIRLRHPKAGRARRGISGRPDTAGA